MKIGDVVRLKSGSLPMTVESLNEDNKNVKCVWFDSTNSLQRGIFSKKALKKQEGNK